MAWPLGYTTFAGVANGTGTFAYGVSGDGLVVVGEADDVSTQHGVDWTIAGGPNVLTDGFASAASSDGAVIVGQFPVAGRQHAFRWTSGSGVVDLDTPGTLDSVAFGVSGDGSAVVGKTDTPGPAFIWTAADGIVALPFLPGGATASAQSISTDGTRIVGVSDATDGFQHAVYWDRDGTIHDLGFQLGGTFSKATAVSSDGLVIVGEGNDNLGNAHPFRWTSGGGMADLGLLSGGSFAVAQGVSGDGTLVIGIGDNSTGQQRAWQWTQADGMVALPDLAGVAATESYDGNWISTDGSAIIGEAPVTPPLFPGYNPVALHYNGEVVLERDGAVFGGAVDTFVISIWQFGFSNTGFFQVTDAPGELAENTIQIRPNHLSGGGNLVVGASSTAHNMLATDYNSGLPLDCPCNFLISVQLSTSTIQVYANDAPLSTTPTWTAPGPVTFDGSTTVAEWGDITAPLLLYNTGYVADFWLGRTAGFVDLSIPANRRKFINADLSPVDLGATGANPFGTAPELYQSVRSGGVASDWLTNRGTAGGTYTVNQGSLSLDGTPCDPSPVSTAWVYGLSVPVVDKVAGIADLWFGQTDGFVDLSATSNRRLFVGLDGSGQYLGAAGERPFGTPPPVFLTRPSSGSAASTFADNAGTGAAFAITGGALATATPGPHCSTYRVALDVPPNTPQGADPQVMLSVSDDGGRTFSSLQKWRSMGKIGEYTKRLRWLKMGKFRNRMIRLEITDPIRRNLVGFYLDVTEGLD